MSNNSATTKPVTRTASAEQDPQQRAVLPAVDVFEDASGITLLADMPGVSKEQLELKVEGEALLLADGSKLGTECLRVIAGHLTPWWSRRDRLDSRVRRYGA